MDTSMMTQVQAAHAAGAPKPPAAHAGMNMAEIKKAAEAFEAFYLAQALQPMFAGISPSGPFNGGAGEEMWRSMQVQEYGKALAGERRHRPRRLRGRRDVENAGKRGEPVAMNTQPQNPVTATATATVTADELAGAMERLSEALARENDALRQRRRDDLPAVVREKLAASKLYEAQMKAVAETGGAVTGNTDALRQRIAVLARAIPALAAENHRRLRVAVEANRRIAEQVTNALKAMAPGPGVYSRQGAIDHGRPSGGGAPLSLSVNHTL